ncbi:septum formation initiator [Micromonospora craterilacus]|uniref:Septum formation initiator n=1 Tax=Micromonospora craterilacus TaxID=1655439 RepID=A0A2W2ERL5_9ACTN|nr:septum formation initiator [Micromonospora craterilacus]PZG19429.1 septum formation initiator [Micromonospora craterilacus]
MGRRTILAVAGWLATAVVATLIGVAAIRLVGESLTGTPGGVRSQEEIARALAEPVPTVPAPSTGVPTTGPSGPTASPASPTAEPGNRRSFAGRGGGVVAECVPGGVYLVYWYAHQGYQVDDVDRGPDDDAEVKFVGPRGDHELKVRCVGGVPWLEPDDDD